MQRLKAAIFKIVCLLAGLSSGVGASYFLVVKGQKLPAGILGVFAISGMFYVYKNNGFDFSAGGDAYYILPRR